MDTKRPYSQTEGLLYALSPQTPKPRLRMFPGSDIATTPRYICPNSNLPWKQIQGLVSRRMWRRLESINRKSHNHQQKSIKTRKNTACSNTNQPEGDAHRRQMWHHSALKENNMACSNKEQESWAVVVLAFNPSTWEAEASGFLSGRPAWSKEWFSGQPGLYRETLSQKKTKRRSKKRGAQTHMTTLSTAQMFTQTWKNDHGNRNHLLLPKFSLCSVDLTESF